MQHALSKASDPQSGLREGFYNGLVGIAYAGGHVWVPVPTTAIW